MKLCTIKVFAKDSHFNQDFSFFCMLKRYEIVLNCAHVVTAAISYQQSKYHSYPPNNKYEIFMWL